MIIQNNIFRALLLIDSENLARSRRQVYYKFRKRSCQRSQPEQINNSLVQIDNWREIVFDIKRIIYGKFKRQKDWWRMKTENLEWSVKKKYKK